MEYYFFRLCLYFFLLSRIFWHCMPIRVKMRFGLNYFYIERLARECNRYSFAVFYARRFTRQLSTIFVYTSFVFQWEQKSDPTPAFDLHVEFAQVFLAWQVLGKFIVKMLHFLPLAALFSLSCKRLASVTFIGARKWYMFPLL